MEQPTPAILQLRDLTASQLERNDYVTAKNTAGLTHEQSLLRIGPEGSNLNWVIGHMTSARNSLIRLLNGEPIWNREQCTRYDRGSQVGAAEAAEPLPDLLAALSQSGERLAQVIRAADAASLERPDPRNPNQTVLDASNFLVWHDTYHAGQTALYRRLAGLSGVL